MNKSRDVDLERRRANIRLFVAFTAVVFFAGWWTGYYMKGWTL